MIGLRAKLFVPLAVLALIVSIHAFVARDTGSIEAGIVLIALVALVAIMAANIELLVLRPLGALFASVQDLARGHPGVRGIEPPLRSFQELAGALERLRDRMQRYEVNLVEEQARREKLEQDVREIHERYALTVERANDGIWEWNLKSGSVDFSVRWRALAGQLNTRLETMTDWRELVHPEERTLVAKRLQDHVEGRTSHFDAEYRIRSAEGHYRWIHSRGTAIRHASGNAYRMVVMDNDVHARKQVEQALTRAAEALSSVSGDDFYRALMQTLSSILGTRDNLVSYCVGDPPTHARTLAYYSRGAFFDNFEYELEGTSCAAVIERREIVYAPTGVCDIWPLERQYDRDSYLGVPMFDSAGKVIGHFACMDGAPMQHDLPHLAIFRIFSVRAAAELERTLLKQKLAQAEAGASDRAA